MKHAVSVMRICNTGNAVLDDSWTEKFNHFCGQFWFLYL